MNKREEIKRVISSSVTELNGDILGSKIGFLLGPKLAKVFNVNEPQRAIWQFKQEFGGLQHFIKTHCSDFLRFEGNRGMDSLYSLVQKSSDAPEASANDSSSTKTQLRPSEIWKAFVDPRYNGVLGVDRRTGNIELFHSERELPGGWSILQPTNAEEHQKIICEFLDNNTTSSGADSVNRDFLNSPDYWAGWQNVLRQRQFLSFPWQKFRKYQLERLFELRLKSIGISEDLLSTAKNRLQEEVTRPQLDLDPARQAALDIINRMRTPDLLRLKIPIEYLIRSETAHSRE